jgi:hypothetical protein
MTNRLAAVRAGKRATAILAAAALASGVAAVGCGGDDESLEVEEGEPVELGDVSYNVSITRFLNPADSEDGAYLEGLPEPPHGELYLAVFMQIENDGDDPQAIPEDFTILDTQKIEYPAVETDSLYALELGSDIPPGGELPEADTTASNGPIEGAMVLFQVNELVTENRPLFLEIPAPSGPPGEIKLDI